MNIRKTIETDINVIDNFSDIGIGNIDFLSHATQVHSTSTRSFITIKMNYNRESVDKLLILTSQCIKKIM